MFPDYNASLAAQQMLTKERSKVIPAGDFLDILVCQLSDIANTSNILVYLFKYYIQYRGSLVSGKCAFDVQILSLLTKQFDK